MYGEAHKKEPYTLRRSIDASKSNALLALRRFDEADIGVERDNRPQHGRKCSYGSHLVAGRWRGVKRAIRAMPKNAPGYADLHSPMLGILDSPPEGLALLEATAGRYR